MKSGVYSVEGKRGVSWGIDYIHPQTGERIRKILKGANSEAQAFEIRSIEIADATRGAINKAYGIKDRPRAVAFVDMVDEYLKWSKENKDSWETDEHRTKPLRKAFDGKLLSDFNPFIVEKYKMARDKEVAKATVNKELILGSQIFEKAIEWKKWAGENPFLKASRFKLKKAKKPGCLSPEEVDRIIEKISHPVKRDMVSFAFNTGWRISEIRKLKWEDVDLEKSLAWIMDPKNNETVEIELNDEAVDILRRQERRSDLVFCKLNGDPWKTNMPEVIRTAAIRAGVALPYRKAWHIFRRTWASMALQSGCDVETLRELGNWKTAAMPLWYADPANRDRKREILNRLPKLCNGRKMAEIKKVKI